MAQNNHPHPHPYTRFGELELILRDELAVDRTLLANERTLMAYLRSAVSLAIAGVSIIHFSQQFWYLVIGSLCLPGAIAVAVVGILRYRHMNADILSLRRHEENPNKAVFLRREEP